MKNKYNIHTKAFDQILAEEESLRKQLKGVVVDSGLWHHLWNKLDGVLLRKKNYELRVNTSKMDEFSVNVISAERHTGNRHIPVGYVKGYEANYFKLLYQHYAKCLPNPMLKRMESYLYKKRFQFAHRMVNNFGDVILMDAFVKHLNKFISEAYRYLVEQDKKQSERKMIQPEFDFGVF